MQISSSMLPYKKPFSHPSRSISWRVPHFCTDVQCQRKQNVQAMSVGVAENMSSRSLLRGKLLRHHSRLHCVLLLRIDPTHTKNLPSRLNIFSSNVLLHVHILERAQTETTWPL